ncbi:alpha-1,4-glucan:maltose-1-phosphate maltosyltransferase [Luteipulveratus mongoliensis]|uniref:Alpha-1,4-glucan:maltose-1-phosphate maltosyltransferase n=1 Tax=Luteipulveratus mongoliensis TaxID=571913 RepID=A0A0K1JR75_9MICO|nr:maltotransferase domain-containing protein [Luteipulveratus mongoliensis]AKU19108.1 alpha-1,4-glucan:maltose-1-phosphate maltosyltransferase [Luteipulveratus mongoliensis]
MRLPRVVAGQRPIGRIPVQDVKPAVDGGRFPTKSVVHEDIVFTATVFREGHDAVNATLVIVDPDGREEPVSMTCTNPGLDLWMAEVSADRPGQWSYRIEGWSDPYGTWSHDAEIKVAADVDTELMLEEGALLMERAVAELRFDRSSRRALTDAAATLRDQDLAAATRLDAGLAEGVRCLLHHQPLRDMVSPSATYPWLVERELALTGAWYEIFPRSEGAKQDPKTGDWTTGTFRTAMERLPAIADMGFDVLYLTPVHPIGEVNRKGPNNTLNAGPKDPGSPYAIGSKDGGHDALHPDLGTWADFDALVAESERLGMAVALDLALQCAPDHPWVTEHPEWFTMRADGTIAYAENPPKKYQDIYPLNFDNDPDGIYAEVRRVVQVWIDHGVTIFRVDNPHTKPVEFWQWLISDVAKAHPEVIWLAEAFTRPAMMHTLAKVGFQQSYTYYAWRNEAEELREYCEELAGDAAAYMRPSFWPTTHDILTPYMQYGGPTAWRLRAALAATLAPTYGIYAGYELMEHVARPGAEEQLNNEKYEFKDRHWELDEPGGLREGQSLAPYLTMLNEIRRAHPALHWMRNLHFHEVEDETMLVFSKRRVLPDGSDDVIIVVAATDPHSTRESWMHLDLEALGLADGESFTAHDLVTDSSWRWSEHNWIRLGRDTEPVHIVHVRRS